MNDELSTMRSFQEPDTEGELQRLRANIAALEADVQRWMQVALEAERRHWIEDDRDITQLEQERDVARAQNLAWIRWANKNHYPHDELNDQTTAGIKLCDEHTKRYGDWKKELHKWASKYRRTLLDLNAIAAREAKLRADVAAWSHVAQEGNVGHGWSTGSPEWLAVPRPMFEKLGALLRSEK